MTPVVIVAENGRTLRISDIAAGDDLGWTYSAELELEAGRACVAVYEYRDAGLPAFFADLAAAWKGFEGPRTFQSLEGQLSITARHDGMGMVSCRIAIGQPWPPTWTLTADLDLGAGAHLEGVSADVAQAFADAEALRAD